MESSLIRQYIFGIPGNSKQAIIRLPLHVTVKENHFDHEFLLFELRTLHQESYRSDFCIVHA